MGLSIAPMTSEPVLTTAQETGDEADFEEAFRRHYPTVYRVLLRLTGSPDEAEDLAQEVFLRLLQRPAPRGDDANLGGWLYRVASNLGFNALRARRRGRSRLLRWARLEPPTTTQLPDPAADVERDDAAAAVRAALAELRERDRTALVLRYSGVSYAEIAVALGVRANSVGTILVRAERALRARYLAQNPDAGEEQDGEHTTRLPER